MKGFYNFLYFFVTFIHLALCSNGQQVVIDRSEQVPVEINDNLFSADYIVRHNQTKAVYFYDLGIALGQIFTYSGEKANAQSLVLIKAFIKTGENWKELKATASALPNKKYELKLILACMSSLAGDPRYITPGATFHVVSDLSINQEEVNNYLIRYENRIKRFVEDKCHIYVWNDKKETKRYKTAKPAEYNEADFIIFDPGRNPR